MIGVTYSGKENVFKFTVYVYTHPYCPKIHSLPVSRKILEGYAQYCFANNQLPIKSLLCSRWPQPAVCTPRLRKKEVSIHTEIVQTETFTLRFVHTETFHTEICSH